MKTYYDPKLKGQVSMDDENVVRQIFHNQEYYISKRNDARNAAFDYVNALAETFKIEKKGLMHLHQKVDFMNPVEQDTEYRLSEEKSFFDSTTIGFYQTYLNVPVWRRGLTVTMKQGPMRIISSVDNSDKNVKVKMPNEKNVETFKALFSKIGSLDEEVGESGLGENNEAGIEFLKKILKINEDKTASKAESADKRKTKVNRGRFYIYKFSKEQRQQSHDSDSGQKAVIEQEEIHPSLSLPSLPRNIKDGKYYLVAELMFSLYLAPFGMLNWRALVDVESNAVLYLRALIDGVNGLVFSYDPITSTGITTNTADQTNAVLNPLRDDVTLDNLNAPVSGVQSLQGSFVQIIDDDSPTVAPPTKPTGIDFDFDVRTNDFAAVSAYYHANSVFALVQDLGFNVSSYFNNTSFPVHVDHRASFGTTNGIEVNAFCGGNVNGDGIGLVGYCLGHTGNTTNPIGRAVDKYVHWHEIGGHGILWDHVESPNFGFAHSAGDGLAAIQSDPESMLRAMPERFDYAPFRQLRRLDRDVTAGWAWGGSQDTSGYRREQILATTHFRIYRAIGGDASSLARRKFASRMMTYLILRAVSTLTPGTNPNNALGFCNALMTVDLLNWTSEGIFGGAYNKVIRWAFEKQGLFQPGGAPTPVVSAGIPPAIDVYINDGRNGEYEYQGVHWNTTTIWNRQANDGGTSHEGAKLGETNYAYVKIKNRGTTAATNVVVKGFHCLPGAGLTWKSDFVQMGPATGIPVSTLGANDSEEVTVGPFGWIPNTNAYGHDCVLMIVSAPGDPSNIDNFTGSETIPEWRLVPHDNNVAQRNVNLVPGGGGEAGLMAGLHEHIFYAGNTFNRESDMRIKVNLPKILQLKDWIVEFKDLDGYNFNLKAGERREMIFRIIPGEDFTKNEIEDSMERDIEVLLYGQDMLIGGMTYRLDPKLVRPVNEIGQTSDKCKNQAQDLLECLNIKSQKVKNVCIKSISLKIDLNNDCDC